MNENIKVGNKITVDLKDLGEFEATAHEVNDTDILFIFDDHIAERPMNENNTNVGGYEESDLKKWVDSVLFMAFPDWLRYQITDLSIPTAGEIFGWDDKWIQKHVVPDKDKQLPLMKHRENRFILLDDQWGWLRNAIKPDQSSANFTVVDDGGYAVYYSASCSLGVRPEFRIIRSIMK